MKESAPQKPRSPSALIDGLIRELDDWRGEMLSRLGGCPQYKQRPDI